MKSSAVGKFWQRPATVLGWIALGLIIVFTLLILGTTITLATLTSIEPGATTSAPNIGIPILICGLTAGIVGLIALRIKHEHSWAVWGALSVGIVSVFLLVRDLISALRP